MIHLLDFHWYFNHIVRYEAMCPGMSLGLSPLLSFGAFFFCIILKRDRAQLTLIGFGKRLERFKLERFIMDFLLRSCLVAWGATSCEVPNSFHSFKYWVGWIGSGNWPVWNVGRRRNGKECSIIFWSGRKSGLCRHMTKTWAQAIFQVRNLIL